MSPLRVTVALSDVAQFSARYGLHMASTGETVCMLPECHWVADDAHTREQSRLCAEELKDCQRWKPMKQ